MKQRATEAITLTLIGLLVLLPEVSLASSKLHDYYEKNYAFFAEVCSYTQYKAKNGDTGGSAGHASMYVKGVCRDRSSKFPQVRLCDDAGSVTSTGTTMSVNKMFKNVNWVAVEGRDKMFNGYLAPGQAVTKDTFNETVQSFIDDGVVRGVEINDEALKGFMSRPDATETLEQYTVRKSIGTDYAISFTRKSYCAKIVLSQNQTEKIVEYFNDLNKKYALGNEPFRWSAIKDNCTHTIANAFHAAGFWGKRQTNRNFFIQLFNLAIPSGEFVRTMGLANAKVESDAFKVYSNKWKRMTFQMNASLPGVEGGTSEVIPVLTEGNEIFDYSPKMQTLSIPIIRPVSKRIKKYSTRPEFVEPLANLEKRVKELNKAEANLMEWEDYQARYHPIRLDAEFFDFQIKYNDFIRTSAQRLREQLEILKAEANQ